MTHAFVKMNGLGNDFVVVEARTQSFSPSAAEVRRLADRKSGLGCDQLVAIEPSDKADARIRFWNADGEVAGACGNASRCVAWLLMRDLGRDAVILETDGGLLQARRLGPELISVDMGQPGLDWSEIPLSRAMDTREIDLSASLPPGADLGLAGCVSMGNPHVVFFVPDLAAVPVTTLGPLIEHDPLFPDAVNVGFAEIKARDHIRLRVWERGAGLTLACGTGSCAALVAASRRGLVDRSARLELDGGDLTIEWRTSDDHVIMTGPVEVEFEGVLP